MLSKEQRRSLPRRLTSSKRWARYTLGGLLSALAVLGGMTAVIDPYFHYHRPLDSVQYIMNRGQERYQNDGILKNFDYDAVIIGTSLVETMKTSEFDSLFGVCSVKVPFASATYREINENLRRAFAANREIRYVVRCLDYEKLLEEKDAMAYTTYPEYLYDSNPWNDVRYLFSKDIFKVTLQFLNYTWSGAGANFYVTRKIQIPLAFKNFKVYKYSSDNEKMARFIKYTSKCEGRNRY